MKEQNPHTPIKTTQVGATTILIVLSALLSCAFLGGNFIKQSSPILSSFLLFDAILLGFLFTALLALLVKKLRKNQREENTEEETYESVEGSPETFLETTNKITFLLLQGIPFKWLTTNELEECKNSDPEDMQKINLGDFLQAWKTPEELLLYTPYTTLESLELPKLVDKLMMLHNQSIREETKTEICIKIDQQAEQFNTYTPNAFSGLQREQKLQVALQLYLSNKMKKLPSEDSFNLIKNWCKTVENDTFFIPAPVKSTERNKTLTQGIDPFRRMECLRTETGSFIVGSANFIKTEKEEWTELEELLPTEEKSNTVLDVLLVPVKILPYQQTIYAELQSTFADFLENNWKTLHIKPRWHRLIIGRTGTGKTHLVKNLGKEKNIPVLAIGASSWIVLGAHERNAKITWSLIKNFIEENNKGIIFLDEIDKIYHSSDAWSTHLRIEVFQLLDGQIPAGLSKDNGLEKKLKEDFLIVGGGAFQDTLETFHKTSELGFGTSSETTKGKTPSHEDLSKVLQRELVNRFGEILYLPFPNPEDYNAMIQFTAEYLPEEIKTIFVNEAENMKEQAINNQLGARMIETSITKSLRVIRENKEKEMDILYLKEKISKEVREKTTQQSKNT